MSRNVKMCQRKSRKQTHFVGSNLKWTSIPSDANMSATMGTMHTHHKLHQLKVLAHEFKKLSLDEVLRCWEVLRMSRRVLRAKKAAVGMTNMTETWTALSAVVMSTRSRSKQCSWLHKVSTCATMHHGNKTTYQCCPGNPQILKHLSMDSLGQTVNTEEFHLNLETSVKRTKSKLLTLDTLTRCSRCGSLETKLND